MTIFQGVKIALNKGVIRLVLAFCVTIFTNFSGLGGTIALCVCSGKPPNSEATFFFFTRRMSDVCYTFMHLCFLSLHLSLLFQGDNDDTPTCEWSAKVTPLGGTKYELLPKWGRLCDISVYCFEGKSFVRFSSSLLT